MPDTLEVQEVRCLKCRRYLCGVIGTVHIKCPSCKTINRVTIGDIGALARRTGYGEERAAGSPPNTRRAQASGESGASERPQRVTKA